LSESVLSSERLSNEKLHYFIWMLLVPTDLPTCPVKGVNQHTTNSYLAALKDFKKMVIVNKIAVYYIQLLYSSNHSIKSLINAVY